MTYLSKTKLLAGQQCPKRLWLEINQPEVAGASAKRERAFAIGHEVGAAARAQFPDGVLIGHDQDMPQALEQTRALMDRPGPVTLFEATFRADDILIRADVLLRDANDDVRLIEVKASTKPKPYHYQDCAIQTWVLDQSGLKPARVELGLVNNRFVYPGGGDYSGLFHYPDVTARAEKLAPKVPELNARLQPVAAGPEPDIAMGAQCNNPYACPFIEYCLPPQPDYPVTVLPNGGKVARELMAKGYRDLREVPAGILAKPTHEWVRRVTVAGQPELKPEAAEELKTLAWPRYYLDFETINPAVPVWAGTRPYRAQLFQWSCHIEQADGTIEHREFLADGDGASMRAAAESLVEAMGRSESKAGPVMVYTHYERGVLRGLAELFPDLAPGLAGIADRLYDLHALTRANYYHPDMLGSWSLKSVLPTVAPDLSYADLDEVRDGGQAMEAFHELMSESLSDERRKAIRSALLAYCKLDTLALVRLARFLEGRAG